MKKYNNEWFFGNGLGLNFNNLNNGKPTPTSPASNGNALFTLEGSASICDPLTGDLLFYTDGITIWDSDHKPVLDPSGAKYALLSNASSVNAAIIVPVPKTLDEYYIITPGETTGLNIRFGGQLINSGSPIPAMSTADYSPRNAFAPDRITGLRKHHIKVDLVTKDVSVILHNVEIDIKAETGIDLIFNITEKLCVVPHKNCTDFWLITEIGNLEYPKDPNIDSETQILVFLISSNGIDFKHAVKTNKKFSSLSTIKSNHDASKIAVGTRPTPQSTNKEARIDIYDFDNATGLVTNITNKNYYQNDNNIYGLEFSKNGKYLYYTTNLEIFQLDLENDVLTRLNDQTISNKSLTRKYDDRDLPDGGVSPLPHMRVAVGALSMGPDGIIYVAIPAFHTIGAITQPELPGTDAEFYNNYIDYKDAISNLDNVEFSYKGLPTMLTLTNCTSTDGNCAAITEEVDAGLIDQCKSFVNEMEHCDTSQDCACDLTDSSGCKEIIKPEISPCIKIKWGEKPNSCLSTCGSYTMCITVCNCYSNIAFKNFSVGLIEVLDADGQVIEMSEKGKTSVKIVPRGPYSFGTVDPCSCVSREFTLTLKCPQPGKYKVRVDGICYDVCFHYDSSDCFHFDICSE